MMLPRSNLPFCKQVPVRLTNLQAIPGLQVSWCKLEVELTTPKSVLMASADGQPQNVPPWLWQLSTSRPDSMLRYHVYPSSCAATHLMCQSKCHETCCTEDTLLASLGSLPSLRVLLQQSMQKVQVNS